MVARPALLSLLVALTLGVSCSRPDHVATPSSPSPSAELSTPGSADPTLEGLLAAAWAEAGIEPTPRCDDATFLRRVSLDLTGRIPTGDEIARFEADGAADKRTAVIDALLETDAFAEHWADVYTELLLAGRTKSRKRLTEDTRAWLRDAFADQMSYDAIATELLTARGRWDGPGPYGFLLGHGERNDVEALTGKTAKVFLGITLECAQCHDHPLDPRYAQEDFYALGAYFARTRMRYRRLDGERRAELTERPRGELRLPTASDDPKQRSGPTVAPALLSRPAAPHPDGRRAALARDIVASDLFAKTVVARTWEQLFGRGLVPRWDDLGGEHDPSHPPALQHLARRFAEDGYDLRGLLRVIVSSDAYQRASSDPDRAPARIEQARALFAQHSVRPMTADQLFRSLLIATAADTDEGAALRARIEGRLRRALAEYRFVFADDEMNSADTFDGSVSQALLLLNGDLIRLAASDVPGTTLHAVLDRLEDPRDRVDALYLRVFGRRPSPAQRARVLETLDAREHGSSAYEDLMHAMLLSSEFLTIH